ncbi:AzlD domain-containing protein [Demequina sediminicola]|uniref:AzlD domain-containing protein n=1 Tax=Demequina sediminicola TaxID=1095026 RepID=UPI00078579C0|nr:AzlD domain-containing protein [Demequina sediminicola]
MMTAFWVFTLAAIGTYLIRLSGIAILGDGRELSPRVRKALTLVAPAAMAAIIANALLLDAGQWREFGAWHVAAAVAVGVALWKRSMGWTLVAGAGAFAVLLLLGF